MSTDHLIRALALLAILQLSVQPSMAKSPLNQQYDGRYLVEFEPPPVALFAGERDKFGAWILKPTMPTASSSKGKRHFDPDSPASVAYRHVLGASRQDYLALISQTLGRTAKVIHQYELATFGVAIELTALEAEKLRALPGIKLVIPDRMHQLMTDAGPGWIMAPEVWDGSATGTPNLGEGVVVGVIDGGVNWDHPAFADLGGDGYDHDNPKNRQFGLCSRPAVLCNDKLIGVYDFTDEGSNGKDVQGHGSHVASIAVGNFRNAVVNAVTTHLEIPVSGVAPHANLIAYKVCVEDSCLLTNILMALDQALADGVDVLNYSLGSAAQDPWDQNRSPETVGMLTLRDAGILVIAAAGNDGPGAATIGSPGNSPWVPAIARITHNRRFTNQLEDLTGGNASPPTELDGVGVTAGFGPARIVHAVDFGNAFCGQGEPELQSSCNAHTGASSPFAPGTFNGEIVVCDRGTYGRIEKGYNLRAAGAGGYVLVNTDSQAESIVSDDHCLPAVHLGDADGDRLRAWLAAGGDDAMGSISGQETVLDDRFGDLLASSSSRGPNPGLPGVFKPDLAAPGSDILAAGLVGSEARFLSGTSMAAPHVTGVAALLIAANPDLSASQLHSILMTSAINEGMLGADGVTPAGALEVGAGRARADLALRSGLFLAVSANEFRAADPDLGGDPGSLNLPGLATDVCFETCRFNRTVTDLGGGGSWSSRIEGDARLSVQVSPASFDLAPGQSQSLQIEVDVSDPRLVGTWVSGAVVLERDDGDSSALRLPISVFADPGTLPSAISITSAGNRGSVLVDFAGVVALPDAAYEVMGLDRGASRQRNLAADSTNSDPYDNLTQGVFFTTVVVDADGGYVFAETVPQNNFDLDLFVGRDLDGDQEPDENEEICSSTSPDSSESCSIFDAPAGTYWILVQNWAAIATTDATRIRYVAVQNESASLVATGPGSVLDAGAAFQLRLTWEQGAMQTGERWYGLLTPKTSRDAGIGVLGQIPVVLRRSDNGADGTVDNPDLGQQRAFALASGETVSFALKSGEGHGRLFVDVTSAVDSLTVSTEGEVDLYLVRDAAVFTPPELTPVSGLENAIAMELGPGDHQITVAGGDLTPGRYYIVPVNVHSSDEVLVSLRADLVFGANTITPTEGLWSNPARDGAGFNLNLTADQLIIEWYTYLEDGTPVWYLATAAFPVAGNSWSGELLFFNWNGATAAETVVGKAMLSFISATEVIFSFRINGVSGSEAYTVLMPNLSCESQGAGLVYTGLWYLPGLPGFGYSILGLSNSQVHVNYLYDGQGFPRWVLGQGDVLGDGGLLLSQFSGFCPTCELAPLSFLEVGENQAQFMDGISGSISTQVTFTGDVPGNWVQSGNMSNLTPNFQCE